jgi:hypothetical protein
MPANNLNELIAWLKANPNKASAGIFTAALRLLCAFFQKQTGIRLGMGFSRPAARHGRLSAGSMLRLLRRWPIRRYGCGLPISGWRCFRASGRPLRRLPLCKKPTPRNGGRSSMNWALRRSEPRSRGQSATPTIATAMEEILLKDRTPTASARGGRCCTPDHVAGRRGSGPSGEASSRRRRLCRWQPPKIVLQRHAQP